MILYNLSSSGTGIGPPDRNLARRRAEVKFDRINVYTIYFYGNNLTLQGCIDQKIDYFYAVIPMGYANNLNNLLEK